MYTYTGVHLLPSLGCLHLVRKSDPRRPHTSAGHSKESSYTQMYTHTHIHIYMHAHTGIHLLPSLGSLHLMRKPDPRISPQGHIHRLDVPAGAHTHALGRQTPSNHTNIHDLCTVHLNPALYTIPVSMQHQRRRRARERYMAHTRQLHAIFRYQ